MPEVVELKVLAGAGSIIPNDGDLLPFNSADVCDELNRGYIIASLTRSDFPILEFATNGATPVEQLARLCLTNPTLMPARVVRFGPTLLVAEDASGRPIANIGTEPFKVPEAALIDLADPILWEQNDETDPTGGPAPPPSRLGFEFYRDYAELKSDLRSNPFQVKRRRLREQLANQAWDLRDGRQPTVLSLRVGERKEFLPGKIITRLIPHWEEPPTPLADLAVLGAGGFAATGRVVGSTVLSVYEGTSATRFVLDVQPAGPAGAASQGAVPIACTIKTVEKTWYVGTWGDQVKYHQTKDDDWCDLVGCGPVSLAMLFGWWDRQGVPSAWWKWSSDLSIVRSSLRAVDAPLDVATSGGWLHPHYNQLHEMCDVICSLTSDAGATWPADLPEAYYGYLLTLKTFYPAVFGVGPLVGTQTSYAWDSWGDDWETSGSRVANGIKNGNPGVVGLGVLWHYVLAYGYWRRETYFDCDGTKVFSLGYERAFKCNMVWKNTDPKWYSCYDVFLGLSSKIWQKNLPPP